MLSSELVKEDPNTPLTRLDEDLHKGGGFVAISPGYVEGKAHKLVRKAASWLNQFGDLWINQRVQYLIDHGHPNYAPREEIQLRNTPWADLTDDDIEQHAAHPAGIEISAAIKGI